MNGARWENGAATSTREEKDEVYSVPSLRCFFLSSAPDSAATAFDVDLLFVLTSHLFATAGTRR